jgi:hypothetical protein
LWLASIRHDKSRLNPGVEWPYGDALVVVNSFVLEAKPDNHTNEVSQIMNRSLKMSLLIFIGEEYNW